MTTAQLVECFEHLARLLKEREVRSVDLTGVDYYWIVDTDYWLEIQQEPVLGVGSLCADLDSLQRVLDDPASATLVDVDAFASVVRFLSELALKK